MLHRPRKPQPDHFLDAEAQQRLSSIQLLQDAIEHESNEERRFLLAEQLEQLEAETEEEELGELRRTRH